MNRRVLVLVSVFTLLAAVLAVKLFLPSTNGSASLKIEPFDFKSADPASGAVDTIVVSTGGQTVRLDRIDSDDWSINPPKGAMADRLAVRRVLETFAAGIVSYLPVNAGSDLASFGLDESRAVSVTIRSAGDSAARELVWLKIGDVRTAEGGRPDTFVMSRDGQVFRVTGRDLRAPFDEGVESLRSRKVFDFRAADIVGMDFHNSAAANPEEVHVGVAVDGRASDSSGRTPAPAWKVVAPPGIAPGRIDVIAGQVAALTAVEFASVLPPGVEIGQDAIRAEISLVDGRRVVVRLSRPVDGFVWAAVDGNGDYARLDPASARVLEKGVDDVRDPRVVGVARELVTAIRFESDSTSFLIRRRGNSWESEMPAGLQLDRTAVERILARLQDLSAVEMTRDPERAAALSKEWTCRVSLEIAGGLPPVVLFTVSADQSAGPLAAISGRDQVYRLKDTASELFRLSPEDIRRRSVLAADASAVMSVGITLPDGVTARLVAPPRGSPDSNWSIIRPGGSRETSPTITTVAGGAIALSATGFVDAPKPAQVRPDRLRLTFYMVSGNVVVSVSSDLRQQGYVSAVEGDRAFASQSMLLPAPVIDSLVSIVRADYGRGK